MPETGCHRIRLFIILQDEGITVYSPTDEQRAEMQKYFKENVWPDITAPFNQDLVKALTAE